MGLCKHTYFNDIDVKEFFYLTIFCHFALNKRWYLL